MALTLDPSVTKALRKRENQFRAFAKEQPAEVKTAILVQRWRLAKPHVHGRDFTAPFDARFASTQDKMKSCWSLFNEHLRCVKRKDEDAPDCQQLKRWANGVCPTDLSKMWMGERETGNFAGVQVDWTPKAPEEDEADEAPAEEEVSTQKEVSTEALADAPPQAVQKRADKKKRANKKGKVHKHAKDVKRKLDDRASKGAHHE